MHGIGSFHPVGFGFRVWIPWEHTKSEHWLCGILIHVTLFRSAFLCFAVAWEGSNKRIYRWTVAVWLSNMWWSMESKINTLELDYVWVTHTLTQCELRTRIYIVLLICTQPTPHRLNEVNILHISKREAFRCLAIFLYNISLERIVCYLTYKMFYDCLIWSILTLLIIRNMK